MAMLAIFIVAWFAKGAAGASNNSTFEPFNRDNYPDYLNDSKTIAEEIAYYSDYVMPLISEKGNGCLGSRPFDTAFTEATKRQGDDGKRSAKPLFHVNRCSQLHASDIARLHYIVALNANLPREKTTDRALRYISNTEEIYRYDKPVDAGEDTWGGTGGSLNSGNTQHATEAKITNDNDHTHILNYIKTGDCPKNDLLGWSSYASVSCFLPSASDVWLTRQSLSTIYLPNINLQNLSSARLFGFDGTKIKGSGENRLFYSPWGLISQDVPEYRNMYYNVLNYALRDCGEFDESSLVLTRDKTSNDRAILLNKVDLLGEIVAERLDNLKNCKGDVVESQTQSITDAKTCFEGELAKNLFADGWTYFLNEVANGYSHSHEGYLITEDDRTKMSVEVEGFSKKIVEEYGKGMTQGIETCMKNESQAEQLDCITDTGGPTVELSVSQMGISLGSYLYSYRHADGKDSLILQHFGNDTVRLEHIAHSFRQSLVDKMTTCFKDSGANEDGSGQTNADVKDREAKCEQMYGLPKESDKPTCATLVSILKQTDHPGEARYFIDKSVMSSDGPKWLPLTDAEKIIMEYGKKDLSDNNEGNDVVFIPTIEPVSRCHFRGFAVFFCTISNFLARLSDSAFALLEGLVKFPAEILKTNSGNTKYNLYSAWANFRDIANIILVIAILLSVFSQVTGWKLDTLGIKKNYPRIIIAAILVNLSFFICQVVVDVSNLVGSGVNDFFSTSVADFLRTPDTRISQDLANQHNIDYGAGLGRFAGIALLVLLGLGGLLVVILNLVVLLPIIIGALLSAAAMVGILVLRHIIIVLLILAAPVVFAASATSATESVSKTWWKMLYGVLITYPIISLAFGSGNLAYEIISVSGALTKDNIFSQIASLSLLFLPLIFVPVAIKKSIQSLPMIGQAANNLRQKLPAAAKNRAARSNLVQTAKRNKARNARMDQLGKSKLVKFNKFNPLTWQPYRRARVGFNKRLNQTSLYGHRSLADDADKDWLEKVQQGAYKDQYGSPINGAKNTDLIRRYNTGEDIDKDVMASALVTAAMEGDGHFEDVLIALNKLSQSEKLGNIAALGDIINHEYMQNGRTEVSAQLDFLRDETGGSYTIGQSSSPNGIVKDFEEALAQAPLKNGVTGTASEKRQELIKDQIVKSARQSGGIRWQKFSGMDDSAKANAEASSRYGADIISSSDDAVAALRVAIEENSFFVEELERLYETGYINPKAARFLTSTAIDPGDKLVRLKKSPPPRRP